MESKIIRVAQGNNSTLSHLYLNDIFQCYLLEDKIRGVKIPKQAAKINYTWLMCLCSIIKKFLSNIFRFNYSKT